MTGPKTNERPGTRAVLKHYRMSATKARQVLDLVRGQDVETANEILRATPRDGARVVAKVLASAVANATHNDQLDAEELYVSACFADEGTTIKRWRPRARGRATRIRKRTCHITVIVARLDDERLARLRRARAEAASVSRARRVAASLRRRGRDGAAVDETEGEETEGDGDEEAITEDDAEASAEDGGDAEATEDGADADAADEGTDADAGGADEADQTGADGDGDGGSAEEND